MAKYIIISGSPRAGGNSDAIAEFAVRELNESGAETEVFRVRDLDVSPCIGCDRCKQTGTCIFRDDASVLIEKLKTADGVILAAPVYYTSLPGTVKVLTDRFYVNYNPWQGIAQAPKDRKFGVVFTYGGTPDEVAEKAVDVAAYAFKDLGFGNHRSVLCGMDIEKTSFANNSDYKRKVKQLTDWMIKTGTANTYTQENIRLQFPSSNPLIKKLGRGNHNGELIYNASGVLFNAKFSELWVNLTSHYTAHEQWVAVLLNGTFISRFMVQPGNSKLCLLRGLDPATAKEVTIIRDTQLMIGETLTLHGLELDGELLPVRERKLKIEFIGDSITSGEGAIGSAAEQDWAGAFFSTLNPYTWKLAEKLDAELRVFSQSGFGVTCTWDGNDFGALPAFYENERIFMRDKNDFSEWQPDAVVINLGTNDVSGNAAPDKFQAAVLDFLRLVRRCNPSAHIVWATGMLGKPFVDEIAAAVTAFGDKNCSVLDLPEVTPETIGARGHPGALNHDQAAEALCEHLRDIR
ncbi:MAG: NAD(P)H-dependent oxidoreductase [Oscillospiraceae bacterium]|jgi:multimeric flavodoxin WrbA/lysophospholipase L1-like esterase|nr:NAD(P)H-dependent oxidoreductase [Oscillospiraceae bacterium]